MYRPSRNINSRSALAASIWLGITGSAVLLVLPVFIGTLIDYRGLSNAQAGWIGSADLIGFALASIPAHRMIRRESWHRLIAVGVGMIVSGDLLSVFLEGFAPLFLARLALSGTGAGLVIAVAYTMLGDTLRPERNTGVYFSFNVLGGAAGLFFLPRVVERFGAEGMFVALALTAATTLPVCLVWMPLGGSGESSPSMGKPGKPVVMVLAGIALFNFGLGGVWGFVERIGLETGMEAAAVGRALSLTYLVSVAGGMTAAWQANRFGFLKPYAAGISLMCTALVALLFSPGAALFVAALVGINFAWNYSLTYQFSAVFRLDQTGRMAAAIIFVQALGLMFGPGVAGLLAGSAGYGEPLLLGLVCSVSSLVLFRTAARTSASRGTAR